MWGASLWGETQGSRSEIRVVRRAGSFRRVWSKAILSASGIGSHPWGGDTSQNPHHLCPPSSSSSAQGTNHPIPLDLFLCGYILKDLISRQGHTHRYSGSGLERIFFFWGGGHNSTPNRAHYRELRPIPGLPTRCQPHQQPWEGQSVGSGEKGGQDIKQGTPKLNKPEYGMDHQGQIFRSKAGAGCPRAVSGLRPPLRTLQAPLLGLSALIGGRHEVPPSGEKSQRAQKTAGVQAKLNVPPALPPPLPLRSPWEEVMPWPVPSWAQGWPIGRRLSSSPCHPGPVQ